METVQKNGRFKIFYSKFPSNIYSILFSLNPWPWEGLQNIKIGEKITGKYLDFYFENAPI